MKSPARLVFGVALSAQAALGGLNLWMPGWALIDLDQEHNVPTYFHAVVLGIAALLALDILRLEVQLLRRTRQAGTWAIAWLGVALLFGYLALDEALVIHEGFYTRELGGWLSPGSPLQSILAWLIIFLPAILGTVIFLLVSLSARARLSPRLLAWGAAGLSLWLVSLTFEGTAKSFFIPRNLYALEVILEESAESLGTTLFGWAFWQYRRELTTWLRVFAPTPPRFAVPAGWIVIGSIALSVPIAIVVGSIAMNPHVLDKSVGDDHLLAGRLDDAVQAYRAAIAIAPNYARAWDRLGIAEFRRGNLEAAERAFAMAERLDPVNPGPPNRRGAVLARAERYSEALDAFTRATTLAPSHAESYRNLGIVLHHLGHVAEAEAALQRAKALGLGRLQVTSLRVGVPVDLPLVYLADRRVEGGLHRTTSGEIRSAVEEYRRVVAADPNLVAALIGLANELLRWTVAHELTRGFAPVAVEESEVAPVYPSVLFTHWVRRAGRWEGITSTVEWATVSAPVATARREAADHYRRALILGAGAPAHVGLGLLAREEGRSGDAASHFAEARSLDPGLPALDPSQSGAAAPLPANGR